VPHEVADENRAQRGHGHVGQDLCRRRHHGLHAFAL
jgi:hypothetical protein